MQGNRMKYGESSRKVYYDKYIWQAKQRGLEFSLSREDFYRLTDGKCFYCGNEPGSEYWSTRNSNGLYIHNGIDRLDNNKGYVSGNVVTCCKTCNFIKGTMGHRDFVEWIKRTYRNLSNKGLTNGVEWFWKDIGK